jgi:hypothetical protein
MAAHSSELEAVADRSLEQYNPVVGKLEALQALGGTPIEVADTG